MATLTDDTAATARPAATRAGFALALVSALSFGVSGALARPLLAAGWSAGTVVLVRVGLGAVAMAPLALTGARGRWPMVRRHAPAMAVFGALAVMIPQFCYFSAVGHLQVGTALMIEFTAPAAVVAWTWLRGGRRPGPVTLAGAATAGVGVALVLDLLSGADVNRTGVLWALGAMVGAAAYFVMSAHERDGLPPVVLATGGLTVGTLALALLAVTGILPMAANSAPVDLAGHTVPPVVALALLGLVTAALAYATGIAATRRLGSRLASFVALGELLAGVAWAWALLGELPRPVQFVGGLLILVGVVAVKIGESAPATGPANTTSRSARPASTA